MRFDNANAQDGALDESSLRLILRTAPVAIVAVNMAGKILFVNEKLCELFLYEAEDLLGKSVEVLLPNDLRQQHIVHREHYATAPHVRTMGSAMDLSGRRQDGSIFALEAGLSPIQLDDQQIILSTVIDITQRKATEETLEQRVRERTQEIEHRQQIADSMRKILSKLNANDSLEETLQYIVDQTGTLLNADASAIFLYDSMSNAYKIRVCRGLPQAYLEEIAIPYSGESLIKRALTTQRAACIGDLHLEHLGQDSTAQHRRQALLTSGYHALVVVPLMVNDEAYGGLTTYYQQKRDFDQEELDVAMLFGTQISLAIQNARLRERSEEIAVTAERNRIARDLHDSVTQTLFSASMIADVLPILWTMQPDEGERRLTELRELTRGALAEMRTLLLELRPATLEDVPLPELLQQLIDGISARGMFAIDIQITGECEQPVDVRVAFFRTAQEAMNNIAKHSQATQATVILRCQPTATVIQIIDNGCGFQIDRITPNHLGLNIMRERAAAINGDLEINSTLGEGTTVQLSWKARKT